MRSEKDRYRLDGVLAVEREWLMDQDQWERPMLGKCGRVCSL